MEKKILLVVLVCLLVNMVESGRHIRKSHTCKDIEHDCPANTYWCDKQCRCRCMQEPQTPCETGEWMPHFCACMECDLSCTEPFVPHYQTCTCKCKAECDPRTEIIDYQTCNCVSKCEGMTCDSGTLHEETCTCYNEAYPHFLCSEGMIYDEDSKSCVCEEPAESPCDEGSQWDVNYCSCVIVVSE